MSRVLYRELNLLSGVKLLGGIEILAIPYAITFIIDIEFNPIEMFAINETIVRYLVNYPFPLTNARATPSKE